MNKKKIIASMLVISALFVVALRLPKKELAASNQAEQKSAKVATRTVADSKTFLQKNQYPANVVGDQEIKITAKSSGTVIFAPANIGDSVKAGSIIAKIDDAGALAAGEQGLKSLQVQQSEIALKQIKESYDLAKDLYDDLKDSSDATSAQKDSAKTQRDIAKLQYENAALTLDGNVDNRLITTPISGVIINKAVSVGDSVAAGQLIASVSQSSNVKIQFYINQEEKQNLKRGQEVAATDSQNNSLALVIRNIAASADPSTKRFLIEAYPKQGVTSLLAGTLISVTIETAAKATAQENLLLPLSAVGIGQNESYIFILENSKAKKILVEVVDVKGEIAEISAPLSDDALIIVEGNKLIRDGETVQAQ
ncbi:MAG: RND family efflux transporter MFP subunit [uncultured bacterium]|nr:MAG: RND family efflux transporter MFP subunit [uncultured bacterium]